VQFSIFRLLLAATVVAAMLGVAKVANFGMIGAILAAFGLGGVVLLTGNSGLRANDHRVVGFSPHRVASSTAILSWALLPVHFFVSPSTSEGIMTCALLLFLLTCGFSLADRSGERGIPIILALVAGFIHGLLLPA
jgi:hypothetical protein